ncbi:carboxymuconolactone decarboxylase family protein [Aquicoccus sp. G2-2]|uniref:carboxymuconolactone decarboxylase family protein n=1 Tax=Aquicoccus sp. G2-2 TaxID=3092120 RepID=UPI002ADFA0FB|nr:carboxymuconolactone decarboxylase family protein [Aquicoccus sp. G2-2]MEA1113223.1 carboxymuconolactone decarboxylase family protein [Aquicoccus sp. G2-2]
MATVKLWTDEEVAADPVVARVFADIRAARGSDFVNNFWRGLANQPALLEETWERLKSVMTGDTALPPAFQEMLYAAVSIANSCVYCIHSHTAAARAKGMTDEQYAEMLAIVGLAAQTNHLVTAMQLPVDEAFLV